jgi:hypothetical protein
MSAHPPANTDQLTLPAWTAAIIESQLLKEFPLYAMVAALAPLNEQFRAEHESQRAKRDARRSALEALPLSELEALRTRQAEVAAARQAEGAQRARQREARAAAEAAAKEAAKFYNQPQAGADFAHWAKLEYWTFDEALALLLGKDPRIVSRSAMKRELSPGIDALFLEHPAEKSPFLRSYKDLRQLAERASAMQGPRLRPADVLLWAHQTGAAALPPALLKAVAARHRTPLLAAPAPTPPTPSVETKHAAGLDKRSDLTAADLTPISRGDLVRKHQSRWPSIETNLKNASDNGLRKYAGASKHGYWLEARALEWARMNNKLRELRPAATCTANNPFNMSKGLMV